MPTPWLPAITSVAIISLISLIGALTLAARAARRHVLLLALVAFAAGSLLGDALIHLLPEAVEQREGAFPLSLSLMVLAGFVLFYFLETGLRWGHAHGEDAHPHMPPETMPKPKPSKHIAPFAWTNLVGDGIHNFIDGILVGASYLADPKLGVATTVAVAAHEIPQELGDFAVLLKAGLRPGRALFYNFLSAVLAVLGVVIVLLLPVDASIIETYALPLTAGGFLYIAAADLVPELHHHTEQKFVPVVALGILAGMASMAALLFFE